MLKIQSRILVTLVRVVYKKFEVKVDKRGIQNPHLFKSRYAYTVLFWNYENN